jgi:hypothetical protein
MRQLFGTRLLFLIMAKSSCILSDLINFQLDNQVIIFVTITYRANKNRVFCFSEHGKLIENLLIWDKTINGFRKLFHYQEYKR